MAKCNFCEKEHSVLVPTIHLNGTSAESLYGQVDTALDALRVAQKRLAEAAPNGRDYYPQGNETINVAHNEHERRWLALGKIMTDLEEIREHISIVMAYQGDRKK